MTAPAIVALGLGFLVCCAIAAWVRIVRALDAGIAEDRLVAELDAIWELPVRAPAHGLEGTA